MSEDLKRADSMERALANLIRIGVIKSVEGDKAVVTIGDNETAPLPWTVRRAHQDSEWWAPNVGEQVVVYAPGGLLEDAFIGDSLYQDKYAKPSSNPNEHVTRYANGDTVTHDKSTGNMTIKVSGNFKVTAAKIDLN